MIRNMLNQGFVIYIESVDGELKGSCLKKLENGKGMLPVWLEEDKFMQDIYKFPNICDMLNDGNILQIYRDGYKLNSSIGKLGYEGPYAEMRCFDEVASADGEDLISSLKLLDNNVLQFQKMNKNVKRKYRLYGEDKFS